MRVKQIGTYNGDIIGTIIRNRNVEDVELFLNPNGENDIDGFKMENMQKGAEVLIAHLVVNSQIAILVDSDADGYTSASMMYQYIKKVQPSAPLSYIIHEGKAHGLTNEVMSTIANSSIEVLIIPDGASNDHKRISDLIAMGVEVIIIDHHEVEHPENIPEGAIVINNQLEWNEEANKNLVGVGMVLRFCEVLDSYTKTNTAKGLYDLAAVGQVGDASDISQNEVRNMVFQGLSNVTNPFIRTVLIDSYGSAEDKTPKDLSYSIIPLINAITRVGTMAEKDLLFRALSDVDSEERFVVTRKRKNKTTGKFDKYDTDMSLAEYAFNILKSVKTRQNTLVKKIVEKLMETTDNSGGISISVLEPGSERSITGLVANKLTSKYQKPALLLFYDEAEECYIGSGRGYTKILTSLKDWCNNTGLVEFAQGHANAFGISIHKDNFDAFVIAAKDIESSEEGYYEVDLLKHGDVDKSAILEVEENKYLFGGDFKDPLFAFMDIQVDKRYIQQKGKMLTFFHNGVEMVMFSAPDGLYESLTFNFEKYIPCSFVGVPGVNNWAGKATPRIVITDMQREETKINNETVTAESLVF